MTLFRFATLTLLALLLSACASTPGGKAARFHEQANSDLIVRFSSWNLITVIKPDTRADGFLPLYRLPEAEPVLSRADIQRNLAVVICGLFLSTVEESELQKKWASILGGMGYQRVVFLRAGFDRQVDGLTVVKEIQIDSTPRSGG